MSKVINKKLHPYYKTGIYGWIGEEVDDNDYIICPICGDVLGMNYWDYSAENNCDNKCPKCKQELDYSEIYEFEDTCYYEQLVEIKDKTIADLETKLAESDESHHKNIVELTKMATEKDRNIEQLKQQLAESEIKYAQLRFKQLEKDVKKYKNADKELLNENINLKDKVRELKQQLETQENTITNLVEDNRASQEWYKKQLAEKEKVIEWQTSKIAELNDYSQALKDDLSEFQDNIQFADQDKISFALEQLELARRRIDCLRYNENKCLNKKDCIEDCLEVIDNQIKAIKGEK